MQGARATHLRMRRERESACLRAHVCEHERSCLSVCERMLPLVHMSCRSGGENKYRGLLGIDRVSSMWTAVEAKNEDRLRTIRALGRGMALGALARRVLALSVLG